MNHLNNQHTLDSILETLLETLLADPAPAKIRQRIKQIQQERPWQQADTYHGPMVKRVGQRHYDNLIEDLFAQTNSGVTREELVNYLLSKINQMGQKSSALFAVLLERDPLSEPPGLIEASQQIKLQSNLWHNWKTQELGQYQQSPFFLKLLQQHESIEFGFSPVLGEFDNYQGELDTLIYAQRRHSDHKAWHNNSFWLNAIALPSEHPSYPDRAICFVYPVMGDELTPSVPVGAAQEWRCLHFLGVAYRFLDHQLHNIEQHVYQNRQTLLTELAPGILHHEMGAQTQAISSYIEIQAALLARIEKRRTKKDMDRLAATVTLLQQVNERLYTLTDAFNNLERRSQGEQFKLNDLFIELDQLLKYRLARTGVCLEIEVQPDNLVLTSDPALLTQLLVNLSLNAINAIDESDMETEQCKRRIQIQAIQSTSDASIHIIIQNNGPAIPAKLKQRIFQRGFTTRTTGHGQGLYIARLVANYLGGSLELMSEQDLVAEMSVGFILNIVASKGKKVFSSSKKV